MHQLRGTPAGVLPLDPVRRLASPGPQIIPYISRVLLSLVGQVMGCTVKHYSFPVPSQNKFGGLLQEWHTAW